MTEKQGIFIAVGAFGALYLWKQKGGANPLTSLLKKPATVRAAGIQSSASQPSAALVAGRSGPLPPAATGAGPQIAALTTGIAKTISDIAKLFANPSGTPASKTADPKSSPTSGPSGSSGGSSGQQASQNGSVWAQDGTFMGPTTIGTIDGSQAPGGGLQSFDTLGTYDSAQEGIAVSDPSDGTGVGPGMAAYYAGQDGIDENMQADASGPALEVEVAPLPSTQTVPADSMDTYIDYTGGSGFVDTSGGGGVASDPGGDQWTGLDGEGE